MPTWLQVLVVLISALNSVLLLIEYVSMRSLVARQEHQKLSERVTRLEEADKSGPGWNRINEISSWIDDLHGDVRELKAKVEGMKELLERNDKTLDTLQRHILKVEG